LDGADVLMADGRIVAVGRGLEAPEGATRVDGTGQWVTPGIIDVHSHPGFDAARAGGITTLQILPGSANLVGGRGVTLKNVPATTYQGMKFPGAPWGMKMACGENPKRVYGGKGGPSTRMGNVAGYRAAFIDAAEYRD